MDSLSEHTQSKQSIHAEELMPLIRERLAAGHTVRNLSFQGVSMLPMLRQGKDYVELALLPERLKKYDLPVYCNRNGKYVIHRVVGVYDDHYLCLGDNTYHYEKIAPEQMVAVVCAFIRSGRRISVENRGYRIYCRVWCAAFPVRRFVKHIEWRIKAIVKKLVRR